MKKFYSLALALVFGSGIACLAPVEGEEEFLIDQVSQEVQNYNQASWNQANWNQASWNQANWNQANWNQATWNQANWNQANWNQANWNQAHWNQANWNQASWNQAHWNQANWNQADLGVLGGSAPLKLGWDLCGLGITDGSGTGSAACDYGGYNGSPNTLLAGHLQQWLMEGTASQRQAKETIVKKIVQFGAPSSVRVAYVMGSGSGSSVAMSDHKMVRGQYGLAPSFFKVNSSYNRAEAEKLTSVLLAASNTNKFMVSYRMRGAYSLRTSYSETNTFRYVDGTFFGNIFPPKGEATRAFLTWHGAQMNGGRTYAMDCAYYGANCSFFDASADLRFNATQMKSSNFSSQLRESHGTNTGLSCTDWRYGFGWNGNVNSDSYAGTFDKCLGNDGRTYNYPATVWVDNFLGG